MRYNFVAESFHTKKLCSRLSSSKVRFYTENSRFAFLSVPFNYIANWVDILFVLSTYFHNEQVAQRSQRDRVAGWVSYGQKWKIGTGRQYFTDIIGLSSTIVT